MKQEHLDILNGFIARVNQAQRSRADIRMTLEEGRNLSGIIGILMKENVDLTENSAVSINVDGGSL